MPNEIRSTTLSEVNSGMIVVERTWLVYFVTFLYNLRSRLDNNPSLKREQQVLKSPVSSSTVSSGTRVICPAEYACRAVEV